MLRAAIQLRTPLHGSPLVPRSFCMSQENVSASVLKSQYSMSAPLEFRVDGIEGQFPRPHLRLREQSRLNIRIVGMPALCRVQVGSFEDVQAACHFFLRVLERPAELGEGG